jgi:hypothetical protein
MQFNEWGLKPLNRRLITVPCGALDAFQIHMTSGPKVRFGQQAENVIHGVLPRAVPNLRRGDWEHQGCWTVASRFAT